MSLKKTTLLFEEDVYEKLKSKARRDNISIGGLVREAEATYYGMKTREDKTAVLKRLKSLELPTGSPEEIERQIIEAALL